MKNLFHKETYNNRMQRLLPTVALLTLWGSCLTSNAEEPRFVDHSLLIAPEYPCTWPSHPVSAIRYHPLTDDRAGVGLQHRHTAD